MRSIIFVVGLIACQGRSNTSPGPSNPGVGNVESTVHGGMPYVPAADELRFTDTSTGSTFNLVGQAFEGELAATNTQLGLLPGVTGFWFSWSSHHPGARVWNRGVNLPDETILGGECGVPCDEIFVACGGGRDCIPSIDRPDWTTPDNGPGTAYLTPDDRVLGLAREGLARAYPLDTLWTHEIVNDTWGDWEFSVAYCPLTATGVLIDGVQDGQPMRFGVSGNLWNSNLVLYDRETDSLYGQLRQVGFAGERLGAGLETAGLVDTTWGEWLKMYPQTEVMSGRDASFYPYGDYRTDNDNLFRANSPNPDPLYPNKSYAIGVIGQGETVIYAFDELEAAVGPFGIVEDTIGDLPVVVAFDARSQTAAVFSRRVDGEVATFSML